jgi:hypothetical protein
MYKVENIATQISFLPLGKIQKRKSKGIVCKLKRK